MSKLKRIHKEGYGRNKLKNYVNIMYGVSGAGKSTMIKSIIKECAPFSRVLIFNGSEENNKDYGSYMFPEVFIENTFNANLIEKFIKAQIAWVETINKSNKYEYLISIIKLYLPDGEKMEELINQNRPTNIAECEKYDEDVVSRLRKIFRKLPELAKVNSKVKEVIKHMDDDPSALLLFDDVSGALEAYLKVKKDDGNGNKINILSDFMTKSRRYHTTILKAVHDKKSVATNYRGEKAHNTIYISNSIAQTILFDMKKPQSVIRNLLPSEKDEKDFWKLAWNIDHGYSHYKAIEIKEKFDAVVPTLRKYGNKIKEDRLQKMYKN